MQAGRSRRSFSSTTSWSARPQWANSSGISFSTLFITVDSLALTFVPWAARSRPFTDPPVTILVHSPASAQQTGRRGEVLDRSIRCDAAGYLRASFNKSRGLLAGRLVAVLIQTLDKSLIQETLAGS